ncbi:fibronectin type III domain-containing protein [Marinoscillum sp. MHG1-6]|uniref:fibronectin type III domain-containing protein n=1 Tax=Marinoscillum sp. MHG1-6 TaxID=2959627 RepID=UPI002158670F|nr:hypothetical protein [Marinoscillum sp. MHG1-6]
MSKPAPAKHHTLLILLCLFITYNATAQQTRVLAQNHPANDQQTQTIQVKWYSQTLTYPEGVHVYRRQSGQTNWTRLTAEPIHPQQAIDPALIEQDPDLEFYTELLKEDNLSEQLLLFNIVIKTFESTPFATFMGLYYEDHDVIAGEEYTYRIQQLVNGRETFLGQSDAVRAGTFRPAPPVKDFTVTQDKDFMTFDWQMEEDRFYAVNLYRTAADTVGETRVNQKPVVITQIETDSGLVYPTPKFRSTDLTEGTTYTYQLAGLDFFGHELQRTEPIAIPFRDVTPPAPPTGLTATQDTLRVTLTWTRPNDPQVQYMTLYRSQHSEGPFESILTTPSQTQYTDSLPHPGPYYYHVTSADASGNQAPSRTVFVHIPDQQPPAAPQQLTLRADTGRFHLSWQPGTEPDLLGYLVYRTAEASQQHYVRLTPEPLAQPRFTYRLPANVKNQFSFFVVALDSSENTSPPSQAAHAQLPDVTPPEQPHLRHVEMHEGHPVIHWTANTDEDLTGYHLLRSHTQSPFTRINSQLLPPDVPQYTDRQAAPGQTYQYHLIAIDSAGNASIPSPPLTAYVPPSETAFSGSLQLSFRHKRRKKHNILSWSRPHQPCLGFVVYRGETAAQLRPYSGLLHEVAFVDQALDAPQYVYQVRAFSEQGGVLRSEVHVWEEKGID